MPCEGTPSVSRSSSYDVTGLGNKVPCPNLVRSSGRSLMSIVGAFDVHRRQLTFEYLAMVSGELKRGRVVPADRERLRVWLARLAGQQDVHFALEGCTGWRYVTEELAAAWSTPHPAEPADTAALRAGSGTPNRQGRSRHLWVDLVAGDLPQCWIPLEHVLQARDRVRLSKDLVDPRGQHGQSAHAH